MENVIPIIAVVVAVLSFLWTWYIDKKLNTPAVVFPMEKVQIDYDNAYNLIHLRPTIKNVGRGKASRVTYTTFLASNNSGNVVKLKSIVDGPSSVVKTTDEMEFTNDLFPDAEVLLSNSSTEVRVVKHNPHSQGVIFLGYAEYNSNIWFSFWRRKNTVSVYEFVIKNNNPKPHLFMPPLTDWRGAHENFTSYFSGKKDSKSKKISAFLKKNIPLS